MTIDTDILQAPEKNKKLITYYRNACILVTSGKGNIILRCAAWYVFWLSIVLALYWPVLPALPYRDHPYLMLNRQLAENDWRWFWSMLSYNRTNILMPGDYFLFRPVHMVVIALQDIFLRYNLAAQGVVSCLQYAFAATVFCSLVKRFISTFAALAFTFLWVSQPVGASIVTWQHITPYILCPAFFMLALRILDGDDLELSSRTKEVIAALCVCAATLSQEIGVATALLVSMIAMLFGCRDFARRRQLLMVFLLPVVISLMLNLTDYFFIHPSSSLEGSSNTLSSLSLIILFAKLIGAIGTALFVSPALHLEQLPDGYTIWKFYNESPLLLTCMALLVLALLLAAFIATLREFRQNKISRQALFLTFMLSFFLATFAACAFRMYSREPYYMAMATYYYTLFSLSLCGLAVVLLNVANRTVINIMLIIIIITCVFHITTSRTYFSKTERPRKVFQSVVSEGRKILLQNPGLCFSGVIPLSILYGPLFQDVSCANRPGAAPLYILTDEKRDVWLSSYLYRSSNAKIVPTPLPPARQLPGGTGWITFRTIPYGQDLQFTANKVGNISIALSNQSGQQSITVKRNTIIKSVQEAVWLTPVIKEAALDKDSATSLITYKLGFTQEGIMLFADGRWIGDLPASPPGTTSLNMVLRTADKKPADIGNMYVSEQPSLGNMQVTPRYLLTKQ